MAIILLGKLYCKNSVKIFIISSYLLTYFFWKIICKLYHNNSVKIYVDIFLNTPLPLVEKRRFFGNLPSPPVRLRRKWMPPNSIVDWMLGYRDGLLYYWFILKIRTHLPIFRLREMIVFFLWFLFWSKRSVLPQSWFFHSLGSSISSDMRLVDNFTVSVFLCRPCRIVGRKIMIKIEFVNLLLYIFS